MSPIVASDIETRLSGGAGNASPDASLGGVMSSTAWVTNVDNNLFDDVSGDESAAGDVEYRGYYYRNGHATLAWQTVKVWIDALTSSADTELDIALPVEAVDVTMATIANESTAPTSVTFSRPTTKAAGLTLGTLPAAGGRRGLWVKRTITAGAAAAADSGSIRAEGDTAA